MQKDVAKTRSPPCDVSEVLLSRVTCVVLYCKGRYFPIRSTTGQVFFVVAAASLNFPFIRFSSLTLEMTCEVICYRHYSPIRLPTHLPFVVYLLNSCKKVQIRVPLFYLPQNSRVHQSTPSSYIT